MIIKLAIILFVASRLKVFLKKGSGSRALAKKSSLGRLRYMNDKIINQKAIEIENITLSREQELVFEKLESTENNYFITGKAGTGKSLLLEYFKLKSKKKLIVVAPTGVAAINVGGQTIHSLFRIAPGFVDLHNLELDDKVAQLLKNIDTLVIDEISMVRADLMDAIDYLLKKARKSKLPFGGVQMVLFGDLYQLPPIVDDPELYRYFADNHGGFYFFNANVWNEADLEIIELSHIFRQKDDDFKDILNSVRNGLSEETLMVELNKRANVYIPADGSITLATTNKSVNEINEKKLAELPGVVRKFRATIWGNFEKSSFPTEEVLKLKKGAQVMMLRNDREKRWVNGTLGVIHSLSDNEVKIDIDGKIYSVSPETWNKISYYYNRDKGRVEEDVVSSFTQLPLRLAWAITIHKSQGQTYDSVIIDMGRGAFSHGQTYVALSRCTTLEGLYLKRALTRRDIIVDNSVITFMQRASVVKIEG